MSKNVKKYIVEEEEILLDEEIMETTINELFFDSVMDNCLGKVEFLAKFKIIPNKKICENCGDEILMSFIRDVNRIDGFRWSCNICHKTVSLRHNTHFYDSKLDFKILFKLFYRYIKGEEFVDIAYELNVTRKTASVWSDFIREALCFYVTSNSCLFGGLNEDGSSKIVEVDESLFFRRKYNRGRMLNNQWYVGGIERGTRNVFIVPVERRNTETIVRVLSENILPGTLVITDQWRAYSSAFRILNNLNYETINHSINFVDPLRSDIHTQNVEGLWSRSKYFMRKRRGISREKQSEYLIQFIFEYTTPKRKLANVLLILLQFN